jgi:hypothetical protein
LLREEDKETFFLSFFLSIMDEKSDKEGEPENFCHKGAATPENMGGDVEGGQQQLGLDVLV